jgi:hypothetical protein
MQTLPRVGVSNIAPFFPVATFEIRPMSVRRNHLNYVTLR